ncbi:tellurite resistance protein TehA-like permease [Arcanobacterium wilhelmae]|uniref:Tellurite resistance protein TehA-like permease n=1 Tax=Arcanobacterium wilhelmae TaxID=1803177 RepID=A0ABT9NBT2_9ACTO|nr:TDT family transporter [Arcanobacterium wilhelmae]MDP9801179.1 tellurite resistance protein TehA-like permease [Arcanobacterium wilhelmae]WFN90531.1 TDT family transporter [Arcanobacterium wilhelmae]
MNVSNESAKSSYPLAQPGTDPADPNAPETNKKGAPASEKNPNSDKLPPIGPAWFPAAMGTAILANLLQAHTGNLPGAGQASVAVLVLAWGVLAALVIGYIVRIAISRDALTTTIRDATQTPMWGTVSMGILSVGSATAAVVPAHWPQYADAAWQLDAVTWIIGTAIGLAAAIGFAIWLIGTDLGSPTTVWGLAVVGPMVAATTGAGLVSHVSDTFQFWLLVISGACFFMAFFLGIAVFATAYHHHWRVEPLPLAASASAWIPLGMVGQSTAAAQSIAAQAREMLLPQFAASAQSVANTYGWFMVVVGIPLCAWALVVTVRGFIRRMPFAPGWWALTFPIGTLALGATLLAKGTDVGALTAVGAFGTLVLVGTVTLCLVASAVNIRRRGMAW